MTRVVDATAMAAAVRDGSTSAEELTRDAVDRIGSWEPRVNAFTVVLAEEALARAREIDRIAATVPGASVAGRASLVSQNSQIQQILVSANYTIVGMIVGYAAITVINSLVAVTGKRRREFGLQRLTGATRGQVIGMVGVEGVLIAVIRTVLGTIAAATTFVPYSLVKSGSPIPSGGIGIYLAIIGGSLSLVFADTLLPAWRGMRTAPIESVATAD